MFKKVSFNKVKQKEKKTLFVGNFWTQTQTQI